MNPGHEALAFVRELVDDAGRIGSVVNLAVRSSTVLSAKLDRARGIVLAAGGADGNGLRRPIARSHEEQGSTMIGVGWCSSCGAYHELTGDPAEVVA